MRRGDELTKTTDTPPERAEVFLRQICAREHLTLREAGIRAGYTPSYLSKVVRGERPLSRLALERLAEVLNLSESERASLRASVGEVTPDAAAPTTARGEPSQQDTDYTQLYGHLAQSVGLAMMAAPTLVRKQDDQNNEQSNEPARRQDLTAGGEHIDIYLTRLVGNPAWLATSDVQREIGTLARHLGECEHCQVFLEALLRCLAERATPKSERETASVRLLERLRAVNGRTRARKQLSSYALRWCALGEHAARVAYPETSAHLKTCAMCRREVEERLRALRQQMDALSAPQLNLASPPVDSTERPENDRKLSRGVEQLARTRLTMRTDHQIASPTLIVSVGAVGGEVSAALGQDVLELSADDRKRIALISFGHAAPTVAWRGLRREQHERQLAGEGPWLAEVRLGGPPHSTRSRSITPTLDALTRTQLLAHELSAAVNALPRPGAEEGVLPVLLLAPFAEVESVRLLAEIAAMIGQVARQHDLTPRITVMCVPSLPGGPPHRRRRAARRERPAAASNAKEADLSPGQPHDGGVTSGTPAELYDTIWLVGMDGVSRSAFASALSRQVRAWLSGSVVKSGASERPHTSSRLAVQRQRTLQTYPAMAAEVVFPLEATALSFALRSAAVMLPELAAREGCERQDTEVSQAQLADMAEMVLEDWRERAPQTPDTRHLFASAGQQGETSVQWALERLYSWATLAPGTPPGAEGAARTNTEAVVAAHIGASLEALRVARRGAIRASSGEDSRDGGNEDGSAETIRSLALALVGYFRWFYIAKLRALDLCELLLRSGQAATMDECATLLTRQVMTLWRWLESATPLASDGQAPSRTPASTLAVSMHGQPQTIWREMADSLCSTLNRTLRPEVSVTLDTTLADPHRLRLWFARPASNLAEHDDPLAWLIEEGSTADQNQPGDFTQTPQRKAPTRGKKPRRDAPAPGEEPAPGWQVAP